MQRKKRVGEVAVGIKPVKPVLGEERRTSHVHEPTEREGRVWSNGSFAHRPLGTLALLAEDMVVHGSRGERASVGALEHMEGIPHVSHGAC